MKLKLNSINLATMVSSLFCSAVWASPKNLHKGEKIYVSKDQIFSNGEKFLIQINGEFFTVPCVHSSLSGKDRFVYSGNLEKLIGKYHDNDLYCCRNSCGKTFLSKVSQDKHATICTKR